MDNYIIVLIIKIFIIDIMQTVVVSSFEGLSEKGCRYYSALLNCL